MIRRTSAVIAAAVLALAVAACGGAPSTAAPTQPGPTPTAATTPEPTTDVAAAFRTAFLGLDKGVMSLTGTATVGTVRLTIAGTQTNNGPDSSSTTTTTIGGVTTTVQKVTVAGARYVKTGGGPWLADSSPVPPSDVNKELKRIVGLVVPSGTETRNGKTLQKLVPPAGTTIDPAALGLGSGGATNVESTIVFDALDDGTPVAVSLSVTWSQASGGGVVKASLDFDIELAQLGVAQVIQAPADVWTVASSERFGYAIAVPSNWDFDQADKTTDYFFSPADTFSGVTRPKLPAGYTLNLVAKGETTSLKTDLKVKTVKNDDATLGGEKARLLSGSGVVSGKKVTIFDTVAIHKGYIYYLIWFSPVGNEAADLATYQEMAGTFTYN